MELKVGMYIRYIPTQGEYTQKISKIIEKENRTLDYLYKLDNEKKLVGSDHFDDIWEASHNIIDLIEVGDYVNGYKVSDVDKGKYSVFIEEPKDYVWQCLWNNDIKSIVTKEQFESMSYKVE